MAKRPNRLWGYNAKGEKDSIVASTLPEGWTKSKPKKRGRKPQTESEE